MEKLKNGFLSIAIFIVLGILFSFSAISGFYTDYHWHSSLGTESVFLGQYVYQISFFIAGYLFSAGFLLVFRYLTWKQAQTLLFGHQLRPLIAKASIAAVLILPFLFFGPAAASFWDDHLLAMNAGQSEWSDPIHGHNASFYMFTLPYMKSLSGWLLGLIILTGLFTAALAVLPVVAMQRMEQLRPASPYMQRLFGILSILVFLVLLVFAFRGFIAPYDLIVRGSSDTVAGAGYADIHAKTFGYYVASVCTLIAALLVLTVIFTKALRLTAGALVVSIAAYILAVQIAPGIVQSFSVDPNEYKAEEPYLRHSIDYTRNGYDLDQIKRTPFEVQEGLDQRLLQQNKHIADNIRLWDYRPLRATFAQLQELRLYYEFNDVDVDRYRINGKIKQIMLSARELNSAELPSQAQTWIPKHLQYTHGYGVAAAPSNKVTREGLPVLWVKDFPPKSEPLEGLPVIKEPGIYFGEMTDEYAVVNSGIKEIDYPTESKFAETTYKGKGGVSLGSGLHRLLVAWQFDTWELLLSKYITSESKVIFDRNIREMVNKIAPFLRYDSDAHIVMGQDGRLYWMIDAYTVSEQFPYSARVNGGFLRRISDRIAAEEYHGINYIRNSVKIVIDAYDGTIQFYVFESEPIIDAWRAIFPELFKDITEMPDFLKPHIRYPETLFSIQAAVLTDYHMSETQSFYNREDRWQIATEVFDGSQRTVEPYYAVIQLPDEEKEETILMIPYLPNNKQNMVAWMAARCDYTAEGSRYGQLLLFEFPRSKQVYGPIQIEARVDQDPDISRDLSLWDQKGSSVIRGNLIVIPVGNTLVYVEPIYLKAAESPFPELRRVVAASGNQLVMRETLSSALEALARSGSVSQKDTPLGRMSKASAADALEQLNRAKQAAGRGEWKKFGESMEQLEEILRSLE